MTLRLQTIALHKNKSPSQADIGKAVATSGDIIGRYERDEVNPSIEVTVKIADTLEVSLDYLNGATYLQLDKTMLKRIEEVSKLPVEARIQSRIDLDALIRAFKAKQACSCL